VNWRRGDTIHIKGPTLRNFAQKIESIHIENKNVARAKQDDNIGIKVKKHAWGHDVVYQVVEAWFDDYLMNRKLL
jgi:hypothetical protein